MRYVLKSAGGHVVAAQTSRGEISPNAPLGNNYITTLLGDISEAVLMQEVARVRALRKQLLEDIGINRMIVPQEYRTHELQLIDNETSIEPDENLRPTVIADALWTTTRNVALAVSTADCAGILLTDTTQELVAAIHSGHAQTMRALPYRTIRQLPVDPANLQVYLSPLASSESYEVQPDFKHNFISYFNQHFAELGLNPRSYFDEKQLTIWRSRFDLNPLKKTGISFDNRRFVLDQLLAAGILNENIEVDMRNTMNPSEKLHSARLDGCKRDDDGEIVAKKPAGAQLSIIALR